MFCSKCGNPIQPGTNFCSRCGHPVHPESGDMGSSENNRTDAGELTKPYEITFSRENQWFAVNPDVKIIIDERDEYRIGNGQTIRIPMLEGEHSVVFNCGIRNKCISLTVYQNMEIHLKWNRLTGSLSVRI